MNENKVAFRHLQKRVSLDKEIITYRLLSRELGITTQAAKSVLDAFIIDPSTTDRGIVATYVLTGILKSVEEPAVQESRMDLDDDDAAPSSSAVTTTSTTTRRAVWIVPADDVENVSKRFAAPPSKHVYALSPSPLAQLSVLASFSLPSIPALAISKWKPAPAEGYGSIQHPDGDLRRKDVKGKGKAAPPASTTKPAPLPPPKKPIASTSKPAVPTKTDKPAPRPMGQLGGMFAKQVEKAKVVPTKRKASPPPKAKPVEQKKPVGKKIVKSNGIFADEELESDDEFGDEDLEAMMEAEQEALAGVKSKSATPKPKEEDEMDVDVKPKITNKPAPKPATKPAAKKVEPKKQAGIGGFFKK